ncbi:hypothetical protein N5W20_06825 [Candidatus Kirkpatrickella diaphorinae]|uniref:Uncharacterized protein n=1 Tax=Candidatus Kirkpatrickella diaphorinae TaxID=2984322 RepID=A0ABY6GJ73_9PROT|nr:hypothetical protein [Candidatus Kirkpatrickella diaphorinae]UYH50818.1 hypothetical protein N5W20_06825 [Candidatus Kirkpatrickella diaphorinae]
MPHLRVEDRARVATRGVSGLHVPSQLPRTGAETKPRQRHVAIASPAKRRVTSRWRPSPDASLEDMQMIGDAQRRHGPVERIAPHAFVS